MLTTGKRLTGVAIAGAVLLGLSACGGGGGERAGGEGKGIFADCDANPNTCNGGQAKQGGSITWAIEKDIGSWNQVSSAGNVFDAQLVFNGILPYAFIAQPDFTVKLNQDLFDSAELTSKQPQTVVYKIKQNAIWDDGTPLSADDFVFAWKTRSGKKEDCKGCDPASASGYDIIESVTGTDNGKTVTVVYEKQYVDWKSLFDNLYPAHIAAKQGDINTAAGRGKAWEWFGKNIPTFSGGPFKIAEFKRNTSVTLVRNDRYPGPKAPLDRVIFRIITDAAQEPTALASGEIQGMYPQPQVDLVQQVKQNQKVDYRIGQGLLWEHFDFNLKNEFLADKALRQALFTAVDRKDLIAKTVGQFTTGLDPLNSHNFVPGQTGYKDVVSASGQGSGDVNKAKQILTQAGYQGVGTELVAPNGKKVEPFTIKYTTGNNVRKTQCELFAAAAKQLGVTVNVETTDDLGGTLDKAKYDIIVFAWVGTPFVVTGAEQLWISTSASNFGGWKNAQSDALIRQAAALVGDENEAKRAELLNQANELMVADAYVLPLYQKPTFLAVQKQYVNVRDNATSVGPTYNIGQWGIRAG